MAKRVPRVGIPKKKMSAKQKKAYLAELLAESSGEARKNKRRSRKK